MRRIGDALADRYRIDAELGSGGMATVYLAEDLKQHRRVAIKVLHEVLAESVAAERFLREIEIAARLEHAHILPLLDSGQAGGFLYYVMPYVEDGSLRERLVRTGELPIGDAVRLISEVVDALAYAHARGIIHRDIKPDNVMLSGRHARVADFGVAHAVSESSDVRTLTTAGVAIGTPAYMSPEQVAGDPHVDHRADIYAVGATAYELLTGRPPFVEPTPRQLLAAHVKDVPEPLTGRRATIPASLEQVVMKCLEKRPADRWQSAEELFVQLEAVKGHTASFTSTEPRSTPRWGGARRYGPAGAALVALGIVTLIVLGQRDRPTVIRPGGSPQRITADGGLEIHPSISLDGKRVAYAAGTSMRLRVFVRYFAGGSARPLTPGDSTSNQQQPRWSPRDSSTILFLSRGGVFVAPAGGGAARQIVESVPAAPVQAAAWSPDGRRLVFVRRDSMFVRAAAGGEVRLIGRGTGLRFCSWAPRGGLIACTAGNAAYMMAGEGFGNLSPSITVFHDTGSVGVLVSDTVSLNLSPAWWPDGRRLLYVSRRHGTFDLYSIELDETGKPAAEEARLGLNTHSISLSADGGRLVYSTYAETVNIWSLPVPSNPPVSAAAATRTTTFSSEAIEEVRLTPDGTALVYDSDRQGDADVYRYPLSGGEPERLTTDTIDEFAPDLSPNRREIAYHARRGFSRHVFVRSLVGPALERIGSDSLMAGHAVWSPEGNRLAFYQENTTYVVTRDTKGRWQEPIFRTSPAAGPEWSPDGQRLIALSGTRIVTFPHGTGTFRTLYEPRAGTDDPVPMHSVWPQPGTIYFKSRTGGAASFWSIPADGGRPRLLVRFEDPKFQSYRRGFTTDGKRFYFPVQVREADLWLTELRRR